MDEAPLDEYALDFLDEIHPDAKLLVKQMLAAVVDYPNVHVNGFSVERTQRGYDYFVGMGGGGGGTSPFRNHQVYPFDVTDSLIHYGIARAKINPQWPNDFRSFTDRAIQWHRDYGGPSPDAIRKFIGRAIRREARVSSAWFDAAAVADEFNVPENKIRDQAWRLIGTGHVEELSSGPGDLGILRLTNPKGELWAERGFPSIHGEDRVHVEVTVAVTVNNIIQQAREAGLPRETLLEFEALMRRAQEELEKPRGKGRFEQISELMSFAANFKELAPLVGSFVAEHGDKIQGLIPG